MIKPFPKIFAVGTDYILDLFKDEVEITEKIDGSQFAFGKVGGELFMRSKGQQVYPENPPKMFAEACKYVSSISDKLPDDVVFYCEYLQTPHHNVLAYDRIPQNHLILFGASNPHDSFDPEWRQYAEALGIEAVPVIFTGRINNPDELKGFLERESVLGKAQIEGVVVKNYHRPFLLGGQPIPLMSGKYVSEKFKEVHKETWQTGKDRWQVFLQSFRTEARWHKAVQHLTEKSELENSPRDIGKLMKEIAVDLEAEEKEAIKHWLWNEHRREVMGVAQRGFPEWYKDQLMNRSFEEHQARP